MEALLARAPSEYQYLASIARDGWAWEFLRRNETYVRGWTVIEEMSVKPGTSGQHLGDAWHLDTYYDPAIGADNAFNLWRPEASGFVLPVSASPPRTGRATKSFVLSELHCRYSVIDIRPGCQHAVFLDRGQRLQISVSGSSIFEPVSLNLMGADTSIGVTRRTDLRRALDHLLAVGRLPVRVHRPVAGGYRLLSILLTLDFSRDRIAPREIAEVLFGPARVNGDWRRNGRALQAQITRALARGRWLSETGYLTLLK